MAEKGGGEVICENVLKSTKGSMQRTRKKIRKLNSYNSIKTRNSTPRNMKNNKNTTSFLNFIKEDVI